SFADGRVVVNAAYFYNDYTDLQVTSFAADPDTGVFVSQFTNAAAATIQGFEMEVSAQATEELQFTAALGLMDASYDEFDILVGGVVTDVSDRPLVNTPDITASLGATYTKKISSNLVLTLHADSNYRDEVATEISATPELTQESYWLSNAFLSLSGAEGKWEARVGVRNIEDEAIQVQGFNLSEFPGLQTAFFRAPRTYDFRLIFNY
ncbi:MAG: TonB-dependent receptor, partial [Pseudomonadota bacterium]